MVRDLLSPVPFMEIHVHASLEAVVARDPKGFYKRALAGEIKNFTGIDQPYEEPMQPEIRLDTTRFSAEELADSVVALLHPEICPVIVSGPAVGPDGTSRVAFRNT